MPPVSFLMNYIHPYIQDDLRDVKDFMDSVDSSMGKANAAKEIMCTDEVKVKLFLLLTLHVPDMV